MAQEERPTEVPDLEVAPYRRFSLRTLLIATTVFAFVAAIAGVHYRTVDPKAQPFLLTFWASVCLFLPIHVLLNERKRVRSISKLGRLRFVLPTYRGFGSPSFRPGTSLLRRSAWSILIFLFILLIYTLAFSGQHPPPDWYEPVLMGFIVAMAISPLIGSHGVLGFPILLGEKGMVRGGLFTGWDEIASIKPDSANPDRRRVYFLGYQGRAIRIPRMVFIIPEDQIPEVDAYIAERLAQAHGDEKTK